MSRATVILIRHGETEWNRKQRYQGHLDSPPTESGKKQTELRERQLRQVEGLRKDQAAYRSLRESNFGIEALAPLQKRVCSAIEGLVRSSPSQRIANGSWALDNWGDIAHLNKHALDEL